MYFSDHDQQVVQEHLQDQAHVRLPSGLLDPGPSLVRGPEAAPKAVPDQNLVPVQGVDQDQSLDLVQGADQGQSLDLARVLDLPALQVLTKARERVHTFYFLVCFVYWNYFRIRILKKNNKCGKFWINDILECSARTIIFQQPCKSFVKLFR